MKSLVTAIQQRDSTALQAMAAHAPPQQKQAVKQQVAQVFNELFRQLKATFPAAIANFKEQSDLDEFKRQWTIAFIENGIRTLEQINIGMKIARQQTNPFLPSPGQFVQWCKQGDYTALGLPTDDELFDMFKEYCSVRGWRRFNWQSNACYWMVTKIYSEMRSRNLSDSEVRKLCSSELNAMAKRIKSGEKIPDPMLQLESAVIPTKRDKALSIIADLKNKHGFK
ncbi:replication protein P [Providencia sp. CRE-3FA-0001]|uniref:Replication protein P n=1 Tax=Providencia huashanensis TaxID=3037798 RepID=A0AA42FGV6_9GAMM|nr:replication protein P [Providencia sp. CRE-3FA-0001]EJD6501086.1 DNA replication protein [Providencia rettgeri]EJD6643101.1 DNA replication protein [Providencia rettgeri]ELR5048857.1 DNA replication protein [Providencia rettgeri]ELR5061663.1 DNA replication protein [Providencia rettgeri]ELR5099230.1 DNA replication protein [Providencia rettgeri]